MIDVNKSLMRQNTSALMQKKEQQNYTMEELLKKIRRVEKLTERMKLDKDPTSGSGVIQKA